LLWLRQRLAAWSGVAPEDFVQVMATSYALGTPLGWHRDAPAHELIAGVSLGGPACLQLRPWPHQLRHQPPAEMVSLALAPRSAYLIRGEARWAWQHRVPPVPALRHSITMRTARRSPGAGA
jgi:alkylated DNA repair dioxygenase AlkB